MPTWMLTRMTKQSIKKSVPCQSCRHFGSLFTSPNTNMEGKIPKQFLEFLDHDANPCLVRCKGKNCGSTPERCEQIDIEGYSCFISLDCTSTECSISNWIVCCACNQSFPRRAKASKHCGTEKHKRNVELRASIRKESAEPSSTGKQLAAFDNDDSKFYPVGDSQNSAFSFGLDFIIDDPNNGAATLRDGKNDGNNDFTDDVPSVARRASDNDDDRTPQAGVHPKVTDSVALARKHEWLAEMLKDTPKATPAEVFDSLKCSPNMQRFWAAEHNTPGGGMVYLVGCAFYRSNFIGPEHLPDFREAAWQMQNFMQYVNMSDQQRRWHAEITTQVTSANHLIKKTRVPNAQELKRFYLSSSQYCLWQSLPIPQIQNIGRIAYVNPMDIIRFAFACGLGFDNIPVTKETQTHYEPNQKRHFVCESKKMQQLIRTIQEAQEKNGDYRIQLAWCTDWRDGFSVNRTKSNRKSVVAWTFSVSPGKNAVNSVGNTFAMALGMKKNDAWTQVEHQVRKDMSVFGDPNKPLLLYHGGVRKMVRVFVVRLNASYDKPERADITLTSGHGSNIHRKFGTLLHVQTPSCDSKRVQEVLARANPERSNERSNGLEWGWSDKMLDGSDVNMKKNGAILPSCQLCRAKNLHFLLGSFPRGVDGDDDDILQEDIERNYGPCSICADWTMDSTTASKLPFKVPDYPTTCAPNCPIEPPVGRCTTSASVTILPCPTTGKNETYLQLQELEFPNMIRACKFAFFNSCTGTNKGWNKGTTVAYLKANGLKDDAAEYLFDVAKAAEKEGRANEINYNDPEGIDKFQFPASWLEPNFGIKQYIETVMHEICLGVAQGNFELCSIWNKSRGRDKAFRRNAQNLLLAAKKFQLPWLRTHPFSSSEDSKKPGGTYGTGPWVAENWIAWTRIQKVLYLHCSTPLTAKSPKTTGNWDVFRLVISFGAMAARALSHSGINDSDIREFHHIMKEFFSCVKELDIQIRHSEMQQKKRRVQPANEEAPGAGDLSVLPNPDEETIGNSKDAKVTGKGGGNGGGKAKAPNKKRKAQPTSRSSNRKKVKRPISKGQNKGHVDCSDSDPDFVLDDDDDDSHCAPKKKRTSVEPRPAATKKSKRGKTKSKRSADGNGTKANKKRKIPDFIGGSEAFWTKSNYLSLPNLVTMMEFFGLLINFWDGGGKGEKFVQEVKPLICKGVPDYDTFFLVIMEKLYKYRVLDIFRSMYSLFSNSSKGCMDDDTNELARFFIGPDGEIECVGDPDDLELEEEVPTAATSMDLSGANDEYSPLEDQHMFKHKAFYCYRTQQQLEDAIAEQKPISGILVTNENDCAVMDFYVLYKSKRFYCWDKIVFDDSQGVSMGGLWYAPLQKVPATQPVPDMFYGIQEKAKMSTVAIPMSYGIGPGMPNSHKFCVITNWWKERQPNGRYLKPGLDPSFYVREDNYDAILETFKDSTGNII